MKILQTIASMDARAGGTSSCSLQLMRAISAIDPEVRMLAMAPRDPEAEVLGAGSEWLVNLPYDYRTPLSISRNIRRYLASADAELMHTNGLWMDVNHATCAVARRRGIPYVITPHGMLYSEALRRSRWKKLPLEWLWYHTDIAGAAAIHVTCEREMEEVRRYGYRGPIAVIPNPIEIPDYIDDVRARRDALEASLPDDGHRTVGFLGRLHPIKQIELILRGAALLPEAERSRLNIVIIGKGDDAYEQQLRQEARDLGLTDRVEFAGFVNGREKFGRLAALSTLMVPSDMENFGMIIPEALLVHTPVMASLGTPWRVLDTLNAGWWRPATARSLADVLHTILTLPLPDLRARGARGDAHVRATCAAPAVAASLLSLYRHLLSPATPPPPCLHQL